MNLLSLLLGLFLSSGAVFCLVWAVGIAVSQASIRARAGLIALVLFAAVWQTAEAVALFAGSAPQSAWPKAFLYLAGPLLYRYFRRGILLEQLPLTRFWPHLLPGPFTLLTLAILEGPDEAAGGASAIAFALIRHGYLLVLFVYAVVLFVRLSGAVESAPDDVRFIPQVKLIIIAECALLGAVGHLLGAAGIPSGANVFVPLSLAQLPLILFVSFVIAQARPGLLADLGARVRRRTRSRLENLDTAAVVAELHRLMGEEMAFADEDISLAGLAGQLGVTPHQLSEILNRVLGLSFADFVNDYRIREAQRLMADEQERTTLSIAFAVGFESKSTFYRAFRRRLGLSPSDYRATSGKLN